MSVTGVSSSDLFSTQYAQSAQANFQRFQQEFQKLGQDLQSGNLSQAQSDFATIESDNPQVAASSQSTANPISAAFTQLSQDLQSGNITAAKQDYSTIQQDLQQKSGVGVRHHHQHHFASASSSGSQNPIEQLFTQLGQSLRSGNLLSAQSAYSSMHQDFLQLGSASGGSSSTSSPSLATSAVNICV